MKKYLISILLSAIFFLVFTNSKPVVAQVPDIYSSKVTQFLNSLIKPIDIPNYGLSTSQTDQNNQIGISFFTFVVLSAVFIMVIHFAVGIRNEFNTFLMIGYFVFGGFIGWWFRSYESGLVLAIILTLLFW